MRKKDVIFSLGAIVFSLSNYAQKTPDSIIIKNLIISNDASRLQIQYLSKEINELKQQLRKQYRQGFNKFTTTSLFLDAAISSTNNLQSLILKESYRNKIASLNNPTSNELGFNLEFEIQNALKPLLDKAKKTNITKFGAVVGSLLETGKRSITSLFPTGNIFTSIISMVSNLTIQEKGIEQQDLDNFIKNIEKYFTQYERLYQSNLAFNSDMEKMKIKLIQLQEDIKILIIDLIVSLNKSIKRTKLKSVSSEDMMLQFYDSKRIEAQLNNQNSLDEIQYPPDAIKSCKEIANNIQRIYNEYATIYNNNYREIKSIINDTKTVSSSVNQAQLNKTLKDLESLYNESKNIDADNLRLKTLFDRLEIVIQ